MGMENKQKTLSVRMSGTEYKLLKKEADKWKIPVPDYVRSILRKAKIGKKIEDRPDIGEVYEIKGALVFPEGWFDD